MMKLRTRRAMALAGTAVALSIALSGCSAISNLIGGGDQAERDEETNEVVEGGNIDIFSLTVGDCKMEDVSGEISDTDVVNCAEPHDEEVFFEYTMEGDEWPGEEAIQADGFARCETEFVNYVGIGSEESVLTHYPLRPTQQGWEEGNDRLIQCVLYHDNLDQLTGSMKGTAQ